MRHSPIFSSPLARRAPLLTLALAALLGCGKKEEKPAPELSMPGQGPKTQLSVPPQPKGAPSDFDSWPLKKQERYRRLTDEFHARVAELAKHAKRPEVLALEKIFEDRVRAADQKDMVRPAPPGFKPEPDPLKAGPLKAKLTLIPKKTILKPGETFWYRAELQNLSALTIKFDKAPSFWKVGIAEYDQYDFYITPPGGKERNVMLDIDFPIGSHRGPGARGKMNDAQLEDHSFRMARRNALHVDLGPGETLLSRPWRRLSIEELDDMYEKDVEPAPVIGEFRELALESSFKFDKPGKYRIKLVFQDYAPELPDEEHIQFSMQRNDYDHEEATRIAMDFYRWRLRNSMGRVESNPVKIEVRP